MGIVLGQIPSFTITSKGTNQVVPATGPIGGGTLLHMVDAAQGIDDYSFPLAYGRSRLTLEFQGVFSSIVTSRPTWVQIEVVRFKLDGTVDTTSPMRRHIVQPGTTTYSDTFEVPEFVNDDDGKFGWTLTHNGAATVKVTVDIFKNENPLADIIHDLHGFNMYSDGVIR